ncbi:MAG: hypothetical protein Q8O88_02615 [bacterium]|nr:hypothetical protein [bacterium]
MNYFLEKVEKLNWRIFFIGFFIGIFAVSLIMAGVSIKKMIFPFFQKINSSGRENKVDIFKSIVPKLSKSKNTYSLKTLNKDFITRAYAQTSEIPALAYIAINFESGEVLEEKESLTKLPIASLTKVMTAIVALDLASPEELFTISNKAAKMPATKIGVVAGEKMTLKELLNATLLTSANDAAEAIKDGIDSKYQSQVFIRAMNEKAKILALENSSFSNSQGFDNEENYSTVENFAILSHYALENYPLIAEIVKKDYEFLPSDNNHKQFDLYNWNGLLGVYPNVFGIKIGNTNDALFTTAVASEREGKKVLAVLLGAPGVLERDLWTSELLDRGFEKLGLSKIEISEDQLLQKYSTWRYWN